MTAKIDAPDYTLKCFNSSSSLFYLQNLLLLQSTIKIFLKVEKNAIYFLKINITTLNHGCLKKILDN